MINMWKHHIPFRKEHFFLLLNAYLVFAAAQLHYEPEILFNSCNHEANQKSLSVFQNVSHYCKSHRSHLDY
jgi:hypothetical protein